MIAVSIARFFLQASNGLAWGLFADSEFAEYIKGLLFSRGVALLSVYLSCCSQEAILL